MDIYRSSTCDCEHNRRTMVRTRQNGSAALAVAPASPDSTTSERRCVYRKSETGKSARSYYRQVAAASSVQGEEPGWKSEAEHVSSVAAEAAKLVAPFVSITPTSPEHSKSLTRVFQDDDTLEVTPVAPPADYRGFGDAAAPSSSASCSRDHRRKRRYSLVDEADRLRRSVQRSEKESWLRMSLARQRDADGDDEEDEDSPPSPKKSSVRRSSSHSQSPCSSSASGSGSPGDRLQSSLSKFACKLGKKRVRRSGVCLEASSSDEECNFVAEYSDQEDPEDAKVPGNRIAYIHVGEGGEADLEAHLKGADNLDIQIYDQEKLPDIDETDMIHGLDHTGTSRDYVDERHRCTAACPIGCQGHLRPNEIVIYESVQWNGKLLDRKR